MSTERRENTWPPKADLAISRVWGEEIHLTLTANGKPLDFILTRSAAASLIERLARTLAG